MKYLAPMSKIREGQEEGHISARVAGQHVHPPPLLDNAKAVHAHRLLSCIQYESRCAGVDACHMHVDLNDLDVSACAHMYR